MKLNDALGTGAENHNDMLANPTTQWKTEKTKLFLVVAKKPIAANGTMLAMKGKS